MAPPVLSALHPPTFRTTLNSWRPLVVDSCNYGAETRPSFDPFSSNARSFDPDGLDQLALQGIDFSDPTAISKLFGIEGVQSKSPVEIRLEARQRRDRIFALHDRLRAILERHEATIQSRWTKKKKKQRLEVLATAWGPGMASVHRPDFDAFRRESSEKRKTGATKYKDYYMWPYINQEDLAKPKTLLLMLNARGRHHPSEFAGADFEAMRLGRTSGAITPVFLNGYVMIIFVESSNKSEYGKLLGWHEHKDAFGWMCSRMQALPGEGLFVLEAQERVLDFLVKCCQIVLHDISADDLATNAFPLLPEPRLKGERDADSFESLAVLAAETPYRVPAHLDLERMVNLLRARASAAEDHVWALREDPGYFAEHLAEFKEHRQEMIRDTKGDIHPTLRPGKDSIFWARIIGNAVAGAYLDLEIFAELKAQAEALLPIFSKYSAKLSPAGGLPEELLAPMLKFRHYLTQAAKGPLDVLKASVLASPPWRRFFVREPPATVASTAIAVASKPGVKMTKITGELLWLLRLLCEDGMGLLWIGLPAALDELERLLQAEPEANELLTSHLSNAVSTLSIVSQCLAQLEQFQPWSRAFDSALVDREDGFKKEYARRTGSWVKMRSAVGEKHLTLAAKLGDPSDRKFAYPSEKRRTREITEVLRHAEKSLDRFWTTIDQLVYNSCGKLDETATGKLLSRDRSLQRTQEWVDEPVMTTERPEQGSPEAGHANAALIYRPLSTLYFESPGKAMVAEPNDLPKLKVKTKGIASSAKSDPDPELPSDRTANDPPPVFVGARDLKVFNTLFFDPTVSSHPGEMPWNDFLHAMTSTGLFTAEKLYGSVWQFQRVNASDQSRIQFHEPHPHGKIPFVLARRFGRRLNRHFGWVRGTFVLKEK
ncbi:hypothetical protein JDV02_002963 [Purpureocillium takamizusanense]|uniref:Uncharacterized protein n=1 Tax=Purpureocillium takamizusanense TaxID=2060973 RepID=A0A9Q8V9C4_9HYPO|nr:uncharacterized protein JDV02_002963 [Purpureocillium takamizusanense]UNI16536.1 hypothetical protein JDV02_002963 [Purpureocillium takamizusanense]